MNFYFVPDFDKPGLSADAESLGCVVLVQRSRYRLCSGKKTEKTDNIICSPALDLVLPKSSAWWVNFANKIITGLMIEAVTITKLLKSIFFLSHTYGKKIFILSLA